MYVQLLNIKALHTKQEIKITWQNKAFLKLHIYLVI